MTLPVTPRIYVASLSDYNAGRLHGVWIDLEGKDADEVWEEINNMLLTSKEMVAEEIAIHDYEGFSPVSLSEYETIDRVVAIVEAVEKYGQPFLAWLDNETRDTDEFDDFEEAYAGEWDSLEAYADDYLEQIGAFEGANDMFQTYFDTEAFARDLELGGDIFSIDSDNGVYIFRSY